MWNNKLPDAFVERMKQLLEGDFPAFIASYNEPRHSGIRVNTLKIEAAEFKRISPFPVESVPWTQEGFYYPEAERPGKHPYYHAGLYYIQEPSAMVPVELLDIREGDKVLDLCAAPGGKSTQIAAKLGSTGIIVVNDNHSDRVKALVKNLELFGVRNAVVLNELPERIARAFPQYFDKILIDAPCSGEGMFRKEEQMAKQWERHSADRYVVMQRDILKQAANMLKPGGRLVYSTCTFSPEENEGVIAEFLANHPDFHVVPIRIESGFASGRPDWVRDRLMEIESQKSVLGLSAEKLASLEGTVRLWPHRVCGEGHFAAVLERAALAINEDGETNGIKNTGTSMSTIEDFKLKLNPKHPKSNLKLIPKQPSSSLPDLEPWLTFAKLNLSFVPSGSIIPFGEHLYIAPIVLPDLHGIKVVRPGWYIGALRKNRFEPAHALAMGITAKEALRTIDFSSSDPRVNRYLKGETLEVEEQAVKRFDDTVSAKGYVLVCVDGFPLGWGKWLDGIIKNEYPAGWRWT